MSEPAKIKVRYESMTAAYASQVIVNANADEYLLDFSSGVVPEPETGTPCVPVHTRIALSPASAQRLMEMLAQSFKKQLVDPGPKAATQVKQNS